MTASKPRPLTETQIMFLLRVQRGAVEWRKSQHGGVSSVADTGFKWSMNTVDAMIRRGAVAPYAPAAADRSLTLTAAGARLADGLRASWPELAARAGAAG